MNVICGSLIFQFRPLPYPHHDSSSRKGCSSKPAVGVVPGAQPVKECKSKAHISQCEMAGAVSGLQVYRSVSSTLTSYAKEITIEQYTRGAESEGVEHHRVSGENEKVSNMSEGRWGDDGAKVLEEKEAIDGSNGNSPLFSFGVITDVQYADIPDGRSFLGSPRFYRHALEGLKRAVTDWNHLGRVAFAIHFGDLVDGLAKDNSHAAFTKVLAAFNALESGSVYHIIGNHCLYNLSRVELNRLFNIPSSPDEHSYYDFSPHTGFRFIVLDGYDISVLGWPEEHPNAQMAIRLLDRVNPNEDKNSPVGLEGRMARFVKFNGGLGNDQLMWLDSILHKASVSNEKIVICCHLPLHPGTIDSPSSLCWNYVDVLVMLQKYSCVVACLSGHAHTGGYIIDSHGIHYVVLEAVLECPPGEDAFGVVDVFPDRLSLTGRGRLTSREIGYFCVILVIAKGSESSKVHTILDEIVMGGLVVETNSTEIWRIVQEISKLEKESEPSAIKAKAFGRRHGSQSVLTSMDLNVRYPCSGPVASSSLPSSICESWSSWTFHHLACENHVAAFHNHSSWSSFID